MNMFVVAGCKDFPCGSFELWTVSLSICLCSCFLNIPFGWCTFDVHIESFNIL